MTQNCTNFDSGGGTDGLTLGGSSGTRTKSGIEIQTSNPSIGTEDPTVSFYLKESGGSPTGTATCEVYQGTSLVHTGSTIDVTTLTSSFTAYNFTISGYTIAANDRIVMSWTPAGGTDPQVGLKTSDLSSYDSNYYNKGVEYKTTSGWASKLVNTWWCYSAVSPPSSGGTLLPPPIAMVRL